MYKYEVFKIHSLSSRSYGILAKEKIGRSWITVAVTAPFSNDYGTAHQLAVLPASFLPRISWMLFLILSLRKRLYLEVFSLFYRSDSIEMAPTSFLLFGRYYNG